jgi:hypothetical protein
MAVLKYYNTTTSAWEYIAASTTANFTSWKKTMSGGETSVSGTDDNAVTLSYTAGLEQVFINGVLQVRGSDYVATNGTSVTGLTALVANDIVTVVCYAPFNVANTIAPTVVDAKGDLIVGTAADTVGRLAVGTNNQLLVADSSTASGLKWANPGLTLLSTTTFSAVASHSVNDVFSTTYDNYKIVFNAVGSTDLDLEMRFRVSGSDNSTANYNDQLLLARSTTISGARATSQTSATIFALRTEDTEFEMLVVNPFKTALTMFHNLGFDADGGVALRAVVGRFNLTTSFTGFTLFNSGTMTGSVSVYGINK